ncbi:MAG: sodium:proton antiporter [Gammaproteobacteria bacterium]|nr:sodium:proton antiporter [Gammaproteobacteria bacterium]
MDNIGIAVMVVIVTGLLSQWLAWRIGIPAIIVLIFTGLVLGPVAGIWDLGLNINADSEGFRHMIGLGVAVVLFEGGLVLELRELKRVGNHIGRLVIVGPPLAWLLGALASHYVGGLSWPVSIVLGAILVVTGPTVIMPLLRHAKLNQDSSSLLKWEGIVNDPVAVLLAVLSYQYFQYASLDNTLLDVFADLGKAVLAALLFGGVGGWLAGRWFSRGGVPEHLKSPLLLAVVLLVFEISNLFQHEAGLLTVTLMGVVIGNMKLGEIADLQRFKESITIVLVSALFIVLTASLQWSDLQRLDWRAGLLIAVFLLLVRPLTIWIATIGSGMQRENRMLLGWIAPRGIVAAATAGLFGPGLVAAGYPDAELLLPVTFGVILVTVIAHGLTAGPLARKLGLASPSEGGLLVIGASAFSIALCQALQRAMLNVKLVDGSWFRLKPARQSGIDFYYGELLSEHAKDWVSVHHLNALLCASPNHFYNALVCKALASEFGQHNVFQLPDSEAASKEHRRLLRRSRGLIAWQADASIEHLNALLAEGWTIQTTRISENYNLEQLERDAGTIMLLGVITDKGKLRLQSPEQPLAITPGNKVLYFAPRKAASAQAATAGDDDATTAAADGRSEVPAQTADGDGSTAADTEQTA